MLALNFDPFPVLETSRLLLRRMTADDAHEIFRMRSNPETMKYIPRPLAQTVDDALAHIEMIESKIEANEGINWAITVKDKPELIGIIGNFRIEPENYRAEIGYMLLPEYHGKGIVSEAIERVVRYGFDEMKLHSIEAIIDPENTASEKALQKNGFVKEAHLRENAFYDGKFIDTVIYSILNPNHKNPNQNG
ncbi:MAG: N-acetyltransferase [Flavobacterium sp.]|nr:MAG: N-acetyltransferase [Flavobacterium sp.]